MRALFLILIPFLLMANLPTSTKFDDSRLKENKQARFNPIRCLTPHLLSCYLEEFRAGHFGNMARVMDCVEERDAILNVAGRKAKNAVSRHGYEIIAEESGDQGQRDLAEAQCEFLKDFFRNITATNACEPGEEGGFSLLVRQMMDAVGKRYSIHEIQWQFPSSERATATFHHIPLWHFQSTEGELEFLEDPNIGEGMKLSAHKERWLVSVGDGVMTSASVLWMYKNLSLKDWVIFNERFGFPVAHLQVQAEPGTEEWHAAKCAVEDLGGGDSIVSQVGANLEWMQIGGSGPIPYDKMIEYCDRAMVTLWRGADLGTISQGGDGVGASLQGDETATIELDQAQWVEEILNRRVVRPALAWRFGESAEVLARLEVKTGENKDEAARLAIFCKAIENNFPISIGTFSREFGIPLPADADETETMEAPIVRQMEAAAEVDGGGDDNNSLGGDEPSGGASRDQPPSARETPPAQSSPDATARNDASGTPDVELVNALVAEAFGQRPETMAPVRGILEELIDDLENDRLTDAGLLAAVNAAAEELPELFGQLNHEESAAILERGLGTSAVRGVLASSRGREYAETATTAG